jgi:hypothetical protein
MNAPPYREERDGASELVGFIPMALDDTDADTAAAAATAATAAAAADTAAAAVAVGSLIPSQVFQR